MTNLEKAELFLQDSQGGAYLSIERREAVRMFAKWMDKKEPSKKYYLCPNCGSGSKDYHEADCPANPHNAA